MSKRERGRDAQDDEHHEPTGIPESLRGRIDGRMGDRVTHTRPSEEDIKSSRESGSSIRHNASHRSLDDGLYRPLTKATSAAYDVFLVQIRELIGDQPRDVLQSAAEESLLILKDGSLSNATRKRDLSSLLGATVSEDAFVKLVSSASELTDFDPSLFVSGSEQVGVRDADMALVVEEDEGEEERKMLLAGEVDEDDERELEEEANRIAAAQGISVSNHMHAQSSAEEDVPMRDPTSLAATDIDADYIGRYLAPHFPDSEERSVIAARVFDILGQEVHTVENALIELLGYDKMAAVRFLTVNHEKINVCVRLARGDIAVDDDSVPAAIRDELLNPGMHGQTRATGQSAGPELLDLDRLVFAEGAHLMSSRKCKLPEGSYRQTFKGYDQVVIPAPKAAATNREKLVEVRDLPEWAQPAFSGVSQLNRVQSRMCDHALFGARNLLLCAPTGAGKTNVAVLCMLHEIGLWTAKGRDFFIVYVAPMKALVSEVCQAFRKRLGEPFGLIVEELSGDMSLTRDQLRRTHIVVTTPEKWDVVTRKEAFALERVTLMIIDEVHLLHDDRGGVLEALVARTFRSVETNTHKYTRVVGLSATLPNYKDVALFLRAEPFYFDATYRPCQLSLRICGLTERKPARRVNLLNELAYQAVVQSVRNRQQVLVFVHSRKETVKTAKFVVQQMSANDDDKAAFASFVPSSSRVVLEAMSKEAQHHDVKELILQGIGVHHAGLSRSDRTLVEDLFAGGHLSCLVSTATLAWGVNLPAHTVVIKGTQVYDPIRSDWVELSGLDMMQMIGRAGRPQFDTFGEGVILTTSLETMQYHMQLLQSQLPIESQLMRRICDVVNAEIVACTVQSRTDVIRYLAYSYLYVRMLRNPQLYGAPTSLDGDLAADKMLNSFREKIAHTVLMKLASDKMVKYDPRSGRCEPTESGRVASYFYITHHSIVAYAGFLKNVSLSDQEIMQAFASSSEFSQMIVRSEEKAELAKLAEIVPVPLLDDYSDRRAKVGILLQAYVARFSLQGLALASDMVYIAGSATRIFRAMHALALSSGFAQSASRLLKWAIMCDRRCWSVQSPLRQFSSIDGTPQQLLRLVQTVEKRDVPFYVYLDLTAAQLSDLLRISLDEGRMVHSYMQQVPRMQISAAVQPLSRSVLQVEVTLTPEYDAESLLSSLHNHAVNWLITIEDHDQEEVLFSDSIVQRSPESIVLTAHVSISDDPFLPPQYFIRCAAEDWLGSETLLPVPFRRLSLPKKNRTLRHVDAVPLVRFDNFRLTPLQSMCSAALANVGNKGVVVTAASGHGKSSVLSLIPLRALFDNAFSTGRVARAVILMPSIVQCNECSSSLSSYFGELDLSVLVKHVTSELVALEAQLSTVFVCTASVWEVILRKWRKRKLLREIDLYIVDGVHLLSALPELEIVVSRARYIASVTEHPTRFVGFGLPVANAYDIADWLGVSDDETSGECVFPFTSKERTVAFRPRMVSTVSEAVTVRTVGNLIEEMLSQHDHILVYTDSFALTDALLSSGQLSVRLAKDVTDGALIEPRTVLVSRFTDILHIPAQLLNQIAGVVVAVSPSTRSLSGLPLSEVLKGQKLSEVVVCCRPSLKFALNKLVFDPPTVESSLLDPSSTALSLFSLAEFLNSEISSGSVKNAENALDVLTWTFFYKRLLPNASFYGLSVPASKDRVLINRAVAEFLSETVENATQLLKDSNCIEVDESEPDAAPKLSPTAAGLIAAFYGISASSMALFVSSVSEKTSMRGLLDMTSKCEEVQRLMRDVLAQISDDADDYQWLDERLHLERLLRIAAHLPLKSPVGKPQFAAFVFLQMHMDSHTLFVRSQRARTLQSLLVPMASRVMHALVDVLSSQALLVPCVAAMEMCQYLAQGCWTLSDRSAALLQVPHVDKERATRALHELGIESVYGISECDDDVRSRFLDGLSLEQQADVAAFCNNFPVLSVMAHLEMLDDGTQSVAVSVQRDMDEDEDPPQHASVCAALSESTGAVSEAWWVLLADRAANRILGIKRLVGPLKAPQVVRFPVEADVAVEWAVTKVMVFSDVYIGADMEVDVSCDG